MSSFARLEVMAAARAGCSGAAVWCGEQAVHLFQRIKLSDLPTRVEIPDRCTLRAMSNDAAADSAQRAQDDADSMGMTADDERAAKDRLEKTGEPVRDALGNEDGAS